MSSILELLWWTCNEIVIHHKNMYSICVCYMPCTPICNYSWLFCKLGIQKIQRILAWIAFFLLCVKTNWSLACETNTIGPITNRFWNPNQIRTRNYNVFGGFICCFWFWVLFFEFLFRNDLIITSNYTAQTKYIYIKKTLVANDTTNNE